MKPTPRPKFTFRQIYAAVGPESPIQFYCDEEKTYVTRRLNRGDYDCVSSLLNDMDLEPNEWKLAERRAIGLKLNLPVF